MSGKQLAAIILIVGGLFALVYQGFTYTKETHSTNIGPLHLEVQEKERVNIPFWVSVGAIVGGVLLLAVPKKV